MYSKFLQCGFHNTKWFLVQIIIKIYFDLYIVLESLNLWFLLNYLVKTNSECKFVNHQFNGTELQQRRLRPSLFVILKAGAFLGWPLLQWVLKKDLKKRLFRISSVTMRLSCMHHQLRAQIHDLKVGVRDLKIRNRYKINSVSHFV